MTRTHPNYTVLWILVADLMAIALAVLLAACHGSPVQPTHISEAESGSVVDGACVLPGKPVLARPQVEPAHHVNFTWDSDLPAVLTVMGTLRDGTRYQDYKSAEGGRYVWVNAPLGDYTAFVAVQNGCGWSDGADAVVFRVDESGLPSAPAGPMPSATVCTDGAIVAGGPAYTLPVSLPAGVYRVTVEARDASHARGYQVEQEHEQVAVYAGGMFLGASPDIPESQVSVSALLGTFTLPALTSVRVEHVLRSGPFNSVHGFCVSFQGVQ